MKRFQTGYSENSISYWPAYEAGKAGITFFVVSGTLFIATSIWILLDNPSGETQTEIIITLPLVIVAFCAAIGFIIRIMRTKIVVSREGIGYFTSNGAEERRISWEDVSEVYFSQDFWYGRKSCRIFLKKTTSKTFREKGKCDFQIPVCSVDEQIFLQLIPKCLWANNPW